MDSLKIAARFAAFACYLNSRNHPASPEAAGRYARQNWRRFLPYVSDELGEVLTMQPKLTHKCPSSSSRETRQLAAHR